MPSGRTVAGRTLLSGIGFDMSHFRRRCSQGAYDTDSALYGADAVAGVVNFILKKNNTDGNVF